MTPSRCPVSTGPLACGWSARNSKARPVDRIVDAVGDRQAQVQQAVDQAPLGDLELVPGLALPLDRRIGDGARQPARRAQRMRIVGRDRPVADVVRRCSSRTADSRTARRRPAARPRSRGPGIERPDLGDVGQEGELPSAAHAAVVFEEDEMVAVVAVEDPHLPRWYGARGDVPLPGESGGPRYPRARRDDLLKAWLSRSIRRPRPRCRCGGSRRRCRPLRHRCPQHGS